MSHFNSHSTALNLSYSSSRISLTSSLSSSARKINTGSTKETTALNHRPHKVTFNNQIFKTSANNNNNYKIALKYSSNNNEVRYSRNRQVKTTSNRYCMRRSLRQWGCHYSSFRVPGATVGLRNLNYS
jgi:hypothetical protein